MNGKLDSYLESFITDRNELFTEMERYADLNHVPIMEITGINTLCQLLRLQNPKRILEIGTAIGYSALRMADTLEQVEIITIERDEERYERAIHYLGRSPYGQRVKVIKGDALDQSVIDEVHSFGPYDAIFIDAAKGQYQKFFNEFTASLNEQGCVYTDNVLFKGLVLEDEDLIEKKNLRNLVKKIKHYNQWLMQHEEFITTILPVGDGLAVSIKR
ncbi:O-methyltransferase [Heyndrickxia ginsengihumi]|uniref:tRNA 5-hydroxyuridine methyltransferase n=1 Tax=Heyndrickxia ginsengihumi TaxID=363870 RepID=A0A6M0P4X5_9BACI|nr:O-methyltransferase [Heyndrickxia ginsengihumi]MBE6183705.1 O-methyltransferase [Bacillus sp. (in: firmicutes)]MCM3021818.1 O-methyltransferase [Heyndrickxia ginsengihumi]NEY19752.1 O-methyltransferase [Heyndrickxia ginsengihumi]